MEILSQQNIDEIIRTNPGDFAIYHTQGKGLQTLYYSPSLPAISGMDREEYDQITSQDAAAIVFEGDRPFVGAKMIQLMTDHRDVEVTYRIIHKTKGFVWIHAKARNIGTWQGRPAILTMFLNASLEVEEHAAMLDQANGVAYVIDRQTYELYYANNQARLGAMGREYPGCRCYEFVSGRNQPCLHCSVLRMTGDSIHEEEAYVPEFDMWFRVDCRSIRWFGRDAVAIYSMDITKQKREEEKFSRLYRQMTEINPGALGTFRLNFSANRCGDGSSPYPQVLARQAAGTVDGYFKAVSQEIADEAIRRDFDSRFDRVKLLEGFYGGIARQTIEYPVEAGGGKLRWTQETINLVQNPGTEDVEGVAYSVDATDKKLGEQVTRYVIDEKCDYIGLIDIGERTFEFYNLNHKINQFPFRKKMDYAMCVAYDLEHFVAQEDKAAFKNHTSIDFLKAALDRQKEFDFGYAHLEEGRVWRKRLQYGYLDGRRTTIIVIQNDVTTAYEQECRQLIEMERALGSAERANRSKSEFLSRISHDIRTPINIITNMTDFALEDMADADKLRDDLGKIKTANTFLLSLINDVLDISKIDSGKIELSPEPYPFEEYITHIENMFGPMCQKKGLKLVVKGKRAKGVIVADKIRINQITLNLLSNAVKYTPPGGTVTYTSESEALPGGRIRYGFEIRDTGIGMSRAFQEKMFDAFSQEYDNAGRPKGETGTGLGLSIVKRVVDLMGGTLEIKSALGKGTSVRCRIDLPDATRDPRYSPEAVPRPAGSQRGADLEGRVLLAEDNPINAQIARRILTDFGLEVDSVEDGAEAVKAFSAAPAGGYRAILMDIQMPVMNGYEAAEAIRGLDRWDARSVPIIAMTADAFSEAMERCLEVGMDAHVIKPLDVDNLRRTLAAYLSPE